MDIKAYENILARIKSKAIPFASRKALNDAAFHTQKISRKSLPGKMTIRNTWTGKSIQVTPERRELNMRRQKAIVGATVPYLRQQEFGGTNTAGGKYGVSIPTSSASNEGRGVQPRKRVVVRPKRLTNLTLANRSKGGKSRKQRNAIAVAMAANTKKGFVFLDLGRRKGIFAVTGGKKRPKVTMMYDLSQKTTQTPRNPWLLPASESGRKRLPVFYVKALKWQLARL